MDVKISSKKLSGNISAITSKSHAHRVLIASALAGESAEVALNETSDDIEATKECLLQFGKPLPRFDCKESGSTLRFLLPLAMVQNDQAVFLGSGKLPERPLSPLKEAMEANGCTFSKTGNEICTVSGHLSPGQFELAGNVSSQFFTGLLFALPLLDGSSEIIITSTLQSVDYVTMTLQVLETFGISIEVFTEEASDDTYSAFRIKGNQKYISPGTLTLEGDWSNAAFWLAAGALSNIGETSLQNRSVSCTGLNFLSSQGDRKIISIIKAFGGNILKGTSDVTASAGELHGIEIDVSNIPDLVPIISVMAAVSTGTTRIINAARLRSKESDRLHAIADCLSVLGADIEELPDSLVITGKDHLKGGTVFGYNDHRIVMSVAIAALCCEDPVIIKGAEAVKKSYPGFFDDFKKLGGEILEF